MSCEDLFALHSLLFASHSPGFAPSEGEKKRRELHLERREGEGMSHSPAVAPSDRPFASHSPEGTRLDELIAPSEEGGMRRERVFLSCTSELAAFFLAFEWLEAGEMRRKGEGMGREEQGM